MASKAKVATSGPKKTLLGPKKKPPPTSGKNPRLTSKTQRQPTPEQKPVPLPLLQTDVSAVAHATAQQVMLRVSMELTLEAEHLYGPEVGAHWYKQDCLDTANYIVSLMSKSSEPLLSQAKQFAIQKIKAFYGLVHIKARLHKTVRELCSQSTASVDEVMQSVIPILEIILPKAADQSEERDIYEHLSQDLKGLSQTLSTQLIDTITNSLTPPKGRLTRFRKQVEEHIQSFMKSISRWLHEQKQIPRHQDPVRKCLKMINTLASEMTSPKIHFPEEPMSPETPCPEEEPMCTPGKTPQDQTQSPQTRLTFQETGISTATPSEFCEEGSVTPLCDERSITEQDRAPTHMSPLHLQQDSTEQLQAVVQRYLDKVSQRNESMNVLTAQMLVEIICTLSDMILEVFRRSVQLGTKHTLQVTEETVEQAVQPGLSHSFKTILGSTHQDFDPLFKLLSTEVCLSVKSGLNQEQADNTCYLPPKQRLKDMLRYVKGMFRPTKDRPQENQIGESCHPCETQVSDDEKESSTTAQETESAESKAQSTGLQTSLPSDSQPATEETTTTIIQQILEQSILHLVKENKENEGQEALLNHECVGTAISIASLLTDEKSSTVSLRTNTDKRNAVIQKIKAFFVLGHAKATLHMSLSKLYRQCSSTGGTASVEQLMKNASPLLETLIPEDADEGQDLYERLSQDLSLGHYQELSTQLTHTITKSLAPPKEKDTGCCKLVAAHIQSFMKSISRWVHRQKQNTRQQDPVWKCMKRIHKQVSEMTSPKIHFPEEPMSPETPCPEEEPICNPGKTTQDQTPSPQTRLTIQETGISTATPSEFCEEGSVTPLCDERSITEQDRAPTHMSPLHLQQDSTEQLQAVVQRYLDKVSQRNESMNVLTAQMLVEIICTLSDMILEVFRRSVQLGTKHTLQVTEETVEQAVQPGLSHSFKTILGSTHQDFDPLFKLLSTEVCLSVKSGLNQEQADNTCYLPQKQRLKDMLHYVKGMFRPTKDRPQENQIGESCHPCETQVSDDEKESSTTAQETESAESKAQSTGLQTSLPSDSQPATEETTTTIIQQILEQSILHLVKENKENEGQEALLNHECVGTAISIASLLTDENSSTVSLRTNTDKRNAVIQKIKAFFVLGHAKATLHMSLSKLYRQCSSTAGTASVEQLMKNASPLLETLIPEDADEGQDLYERLSQDLSLGHYQELSTQLTHTITKSLAPPKEKDTGCCKLVAAHIQSFMENISRWVHRQKQNTRQQDPVWKCMKRIHKQVSEMTSPKIHFPEEPMSPETPCPEEEPICNPGKTTQDQTPSPQTRLTIQENGISTATPSEFCEEGSVTPLCDERSITEQDRAPTHMSPLHLQQDLTEQLQAVVQRYLDKVSQRNESMNVLTAQMLVEIICTLSDMILEVFRRSVQLGTKHTLQVTEETVEQAVQPGLSHSFKTILGSTHQDFDPLFKLLSAEVYLSVKSGLNQEQADNTCYLPPKQRLKDMLRYVKGMFRPTKDQIGESCHPCETQVSDNEKESSTTAQEQQDQSPLQKSDDARTSPQNSEPRVWSRLASPNTAPPSVPEGSTSEAKLPSPEKNPLEPDVTTDTAATKQSDKQENYKQKRAKKNNKLQAAVDSVMEKKGKEKKHKEWTKSEKYKLLCAVSARVLQTKDHKEVEEFANGLKELALKRPNWKIGVKPGKQSIKDVAYFVHKDLCHMRDANRDHNADCLDPNYKIVILDSIQKNMKKPRLRLTAHLVLTVVKKVVVKIDKWFWKKFVPTIDDVEMYRSHKGPVTELHIVDQYMMEMCNIPFLSSQLDLLLTLRELPVSVNDLQPLINQKIRMCQRLCDSRSFVSVLQYLLVIGNYLNENAGKEKAKGFRLSTLTKTVQLRGSDRHFTLLHALVEQVLLQDPSLVAFMEELAEFETVPGASIKGLTAEVDVLKNELQKIVQYRKTTKKRKLGDTYPNFIKNLKTVIERYQSDLSALTKTCEEMKKLYSVILVKFGEAADQDSQELFGVISQFIHDFRRAHAETV